MKSITLFFTNSKLGLICKKTYKISLWQCDPYFDDIGCSHPGCEPAYPTPKCVKKCVNKNQLWNDSKRYSVSAYRISSNPHDIMAEVYKNGPVEVSFTVYEVNHRLPYVPVAVFASMFVDTNLFMVRFACICCCILKNYKPISIYFLLFSPSIYL